MKDVTSKVIAPYFHQAYFEKTRQFPFKKYLSFNDIADVLKHYPVLMKRNEKGSMANLIENKYEYWKNRRKIDAYDYLKSVLRLKPYDKYRPELSPIWGQLDDIRLEHIDTRIKFGNIISYVRLHDNIFQSIDGLIINNMYNNYNNLAAINDITESPYKNELFDIQFVGLPLVYNDGFERLTVGPELLLILKILKH
jgi:hypothetical protein